MIIVYITYPDLKTARKIVTHLLKKRLIACAHILPAGESSYWWSGKIAKSKEVTSIAKATAKHWKRIIQEVEKLHPYDVPCIVKMNAAANRRFSSWISSSTPGVE